MQMWGSRVAWGSCCQQRHTGETGVFSTFVARIAVPASYLGKILSHQVSASSLDLD